jgi:NAD(P)-dependent dehydrogenase (short-subunit alcohol dehydrogenase family)
MSDPTALATRAGKGIGKQVAAQLAATGTSVHVGSRDPERGQQAVDEVGGRSLLALGHRAEGFLAAVGDLSRPAGHTASLPKGTWRPLGAGLARGRCRAAKPAPSRRGRMRERPRPWEPR